jgi:outer membrane receptor for monomeric catechols
VCSVLHFDDARGLRSNNPAEVGKVSGRECREHLITCTARITSRGQPHGMRYGTTPTPGSWIPDAGRDGFISSTAISIRHNLSNVNNAYYFERLGGGHQIPGAGRYALVTTNFHF